MARSAYQIQFSGSHPPFQMGKFWKGKTKPKIKVFGWIALHQKIVTADNLASRGMQHNPLCPKILPCFYFLLSFPLWPASIPYAIFLVYHILSDIIFCWPNQQFGSTAHSAHRPNFLWSSSTSKRQPQPSTSPAVATLFAVSSGFNTMETPRLASSLSSPPNTPAPHRLPFLIFISHNRCH
jgi:hypothetical protein